MYVHLQRGGWACFPSNMYVCIMTLMAFARKEILFFSASEVSVQGPWKIISSPRQAELSAILTGFEKCACACVHICALTAALWSPPPPHFFCFFPPTHLLYTDFQQSPANHSLPSFSCLYLRHTACVAMVITDAPSPHNVSSCVGVRLNCGWWCRQTADVITSLGNKAYFYRWAQSTVHVCGAPSPLSRPGWLPQCNCISASHSDCCWQQQSCSVVSAWLCQCVNSTLGWWFLKPCRFVLGWDDSNHHGSMLLSGCFALLRCWSITCVVQVWTCITTAGTSQTHNYDSFLFSVGPEKNPLVYIGNDIHNHTKPQSAFWLFSTWCY